MKLSPDSKLHIYYIQGILPRNTTIDHSHYLGNWEEDGFSFLFFTVEAHSNVLELVKAHPELQLLDTFEMTYEQWQGGKLEPQQIGSFLVTPPWFTPPEEEPSVVLSIDPGVVFGNGLHPTTRDCLQAIEIACSGGKVQTMLDLGTGTGILAIAAAKSGCGRALALDFNLLAAQTARQNVGRNDLAERIVVVQAQAEPFTSISTDLLVANIHYAVMKELLKSPGFLHQKWFILSGLLNSEAEKVEATLKELPVLILNRWCRDATWNTFLGITT